MAFAPKMFRVAFTGDFYGADGSPKYRDTGLSVLAAHTHIRHSRFAEHRAEIGTDQIGDAQGVVVLTPAVTAASVAESRDLLAIGRFGVGYDAVDVKPCTEADVVVFITVGAVDHSVAEATVGWMIALTHHIRIKDLLVRDGKWDQRSHFLGRELRDRAFGAIGLGGIARKAIALLKGFGMKQPLAYDPYVAAQAAAEMGVRLVSLDELLTTADFVSIHCVVMCLPSTPPALSIWAIRIWRSSPDWRSYGARMPVFAAEIPIRIVPEVGRLLRSTWVAGSHSLERTIALAHWK